MSFGINFNKIGGWFGRSRVLENQIDEFLDKISEAGLVFSRAMKVYLEQGSCAEFEGFGKCRDGSMSLCDSDLRLH